MSYQAVIRNSSNNLVTSSSIGIQVSILQGSVSGTEVFRETYNPNPQTNANGLVTLEIGSGMALSGSFTSINWANGPYFIKTEIDPLGGTDFTITGIIEMLSVPYALFAKTAENISGNIAEADPVFTNHAAFGINPTNISNWNSAYSWGNHYNLYSLIDHSHQYLPLLGGEMLNTNVVTNLNAELLDGQHSSFFAPSSVYPAQGLTEGYIPYKTSTVLANTPLWTDGINIGFGTIEPLFPLDIWKSQDATTLIRVRNSDSGVNAYSGIGINAHGNSWGIRTGSLAANNNTFEIVSNYFDSPGIKFSINTNGEAVFSSNVDATSYKLSGVPAFLDWARQGFAGAPGQLLISQGASTTPNWRNLNDIGVVLKSPVSAQQGNIWINGNITIPYSTASMGIIYKENKPFIHNYAAPGSDGHNTFVGLDAGNFTLDLAGNISNFSSDNTGVGYLSLSKNTTGKDNSGFGKGTLSENTEGNWNTAIGVDVLRANTSGIANAALGVDALLNNKSGSENTSVGNNSLLNNIIGGANAAFGNAALFSNVGGGENVAVGYQSLFSSNSSYNVAIGSTAARHVRGGNGNTFIGARAGYNANQKIDVANSMALGYEAYTTADNQVVIGNNSVTSVKTSGQIETTVSTGTSPFKIVSTTVNTNLNADLLDGQHGSFYAPAISSANYIQNQNATAQIANLWINGTGTFNGAIRSTSISGWAIGSISDVARIEYISNQFQALSATNTFTGFKGTTFESTVNTGTAPLKIASSTLVPNLNSDLLDGQHGSYYAISSVYPSSGLSAGFVPYKSKTVLTNSSIYTDGIRVGINTSVLDEIFKVSVGNNKHFRIGASFANGIATDGVVLGLSRASDGAQVGAIGTILSDFIFSARSNYHFYSNAIEKMTILQSGSVGIGYSAGSEITNNKLAVNGSIYANGILSTNGGNSTNWNTAYSWGNHTGLYRPVSYVPAWNEISSNPFSFNSVADNQLLKYNASTSKWENWTPDFDLFFNEVDPVFAAWDKASGIIITSSQVADFQTSVTNNSAVIANTEKKGYPSADEAKLAGIEVGAEKNVNADWNASGGDAQILNKPNIPKGINPGDMQYWDGTSWVLVEAGQPGQFLQFTGSNKPEWATVIPIISTIGVSEITTNSAICGGNVISDGGGTILTRGVCWSTSPNPTLSDNKTTNETGTGIFTSLITGLIKETTYYVRAYVTNTSFTAYGNEVSFLTAP